MPRHRRLPAVSTALATAGVLVTATAGSAAALPAPTRISLVPIGTYATGIFDGAAAEIVAHDPQTQRLFVVNANLGLVEVLDIADPSNPTLVTTIEASGEVNSVAVRDGVVAAAVQADPVQEPGRVELFDTDGTLLAGVTVGALPDMVTFTPDGRTILVANEGEPAGYCPGDAGDPEGSVSVIDVSAGAAAVTQDDVRTADFAAYNGSADELRAAGIRIFGPGASVAQDLEPEYVAVDADSATAWVTLQENNALAVVDIATATVTDLLPLGYKDHSTVRNAFDASNEDDGVNIRPWPVNGMYMPDGMDSYQRGGSTFLVTANEGDARDYECFAEEERIGDLTLDPAAFPFAERLQADERLGRLQTTTASPTTSPATELYSFGARSFSIWDDTGQLVFDSGSAFERITAASNQAVFNATNDDNDSFDSRSDDKGPEPEGIEIGNAFGSTYAFIGLERVGGIVVYDITSPTRPRFVEYENNRHYEGDPEAGTAGDLGPEGIAFIAAGDSPVALPLLAVANEVSGTTTLYEVRPGYGR
ncbi:MAG: choice-of-anchor I family protein [Actinomycetota bacterium]|nr:choice-of-anchor I family protein [Actinomycetota bacterium]